MRSAPSASELANHGFRLRLKKSFDALKFTARRATSPSKHVISPGCRPESVELARAQYLQACGSPSSIQRSPKHDDRLKKRIEETNVACHDNDEPIQYYDKSEMVDSAVKTARSISSSLRRRFKRTFSKPQAGIPPQQLNASRAHFGDGSFGATGNGGFDSYLRDQDIHFGRDSFYDNPWHEKVGDHDLNQVIDLGLANTSKASLTSSKSRVTSWTNTTATGSMHELPIERKRLSVIQEDGGPHVPSSSAGTHLGGVYIARKPVPPPSLPDSRRLYSALVKRIEQEEKDAAARDMKNEAEGHLETGLIGEAYTRTIRAVDDNNDLEERAVKYAESQKTASHMQHLVANVRQDVGFAKYNQSEESFYSRQTDGEMDHTFNRKFNFSENTLDISRQNTAINNPYESMSYQNPYLNSEISVDEQRASNDYTLTRNSDDVQHASNRSGLHVRQNSVRDAQHYIIPKTEPVESRNTNQERDQPKLGHRREEAQIVNDSNDTPHLKGSDQLEHTPFGLQRQPTLSLRKEGVRTPEPPGGAPDQLSVAKKRFPLLTLKQVTKVVTPVPSRNNSLQRSQSGLLQQANNAEPPTISKDISHQDKSGRIAASLRKISPENVANMLRGKKSVAALMHRSHDKENRLDQSPTVLQDEAAEPISTPGPAYLAMRSGNSGGRPISKVADKVKITESPTDMIKATLSARLSRPFNMDTPELNRPFDSMYLGKREVGLSDASGGRLSVAHNQKLGYDKRRSFERGPGGYGGLGPSPFERTPSRRDSETALPHFPTPEQGKSTASGRIGASTATKRIVSNFLRSRRKDSSSGESRAKHEEEIGKRVREETPARSSPLFI